ncbi:zinc ribbon domain-containing protein [Candidatus Micrarchaeota archaeon]|nr:zinc ribbon domain-containing protein [Candidatus Micrarchaeota archaeon]
MGIFDNILNQVTSRLKNDIEYKTSSGISNTIDQGAKKVLEGDKTPRCPKCKKPIEHGMKFCSGCGVKLVVSCTKCNLEFPLGTRFCSGCGGKIQ